MEALQRWQVVHLGSGAGVLAKEALCKAAGRLIPGGGLDAARRPLRPRLIQEVRQSERLPGMLPHKPAIVLAHSFSYSLRV